MISVAVPLATVRALQPKAVIQRSSRSQPHQSLQPSPAEAVASRCALSNSLTMSSLGTRSPARQLRFARGGLVDSLVRLETTEYTPGVPERSTQWVVRSRATVLGCWAVVLVMGVLGAARLPGLLTTSLAVPSTSSAQANAILVAHFGDDVEGSYTVVFRVPQATLAEARSLQRRTAIAASVVPTGSVTGFHPAPGIVVGTIDSRLDLRQAASHVDALRAALDAAGLPPSLVTGPAALQNDITPILSSDLRRGELVGGAPRTRSHRAASRLVAVGRDPVHRGCCDGERFSRHPLRARTRCPHGAVRPQCRCADRLRSRDRLLTAHRVPIPRGAGPDYAGGRRRSHAQCRAQGPPWSARASPSRSALGVLLFSSRCRLSGRSASPGSSSRSSRSPRRSPCSQPFSRCSGARGARGDGHGVDDWRAAGGGLWAPPRAHRPAPSGARAVRRVDRARGGGPAVRCGCELTPGSFTAVPSGLPSTRGLDLVADRGSGPGAVDPDRRRRRRRRARVALRSPGVVAATSGSSVN